jgi:peptidoglycan hydrolase-like protein with peptidoglycan-binding domain
VSQVSQETTQNTTGPGARTAFAPEAAPVQLQQGGAAGGAPVGEGAGSATEGLSPSAAAAAPVMAHWAEEGVAAAPQPTLRVGSSGEAVRRLQELLNQRGAGLVPDGQFGPKTRSAVVAFQQGSGLTPDGVVGPMTWGALLGTAPPKTEKPPEGKPPEGKKEGIEPDKGTGTGTGTATTPPPGDKVVSGSRQAIIAVARAEVGNGVAARIPGEPDETGKATRKGWERLLEYFTVAYGGTLPMPHMKDIIKYHKYGMGAQSGGLQSWCGIFANWACKTAGVSVPNWKIGGTPMGPFSQNPEPGDIGYIDQPFQHHCVVIAVDGDTITSVDGNSGADSSVQLRTRSRSQFTLFMKVPA